MLLGRARSQIKGKWIAGAFAGVSLATAAMAATPESDYLAARDRAVAALAAKHTSGASDDALNAEEDRALAALKARLVAMIGDAPPQGFAGPPGMGPMSLQDGIGFDALHGLVFVKGETARALVTTVGLLRAWLATHRAWWPTLKDPPHEIDAVLHTGDFYTQAIDPDAAFSIFSTVPIGVPAGASAAVAVLVEQSQDMATVPPDHLVVSVIKDDRFLVAFVPADGTPLAIAACEALWKGYAKKRDAASDANKLDASTKIEIEGETAYHRCYGQQARTQPYFVRLIDQATKLATTLAARADGNKTSPAAKQ